MKASLEEDDAVARRAWPDVHEGNVQNIGDIATFVL